MGFRQLNILFRYFAEVITAKLSVFGQINILIWFREKKCKLSIVIFNMAAVRSYGIVLGDNHRFWRYAKADNVQKFVSSF